MPDERFLSRARVASTLGVTPSTVTRWAKTGLIPTVVTLGGHHRYYESDILRLQRELARSRAPAGDRGKARKVADSSPSKAPGLSTQSRRGRRSLKASGRSNGREGLMEIRWHGRGGQGVVTAGEILAEAALLEDRYFQAFPEFGPERTGAPVRAFTRISSTPITLHCPISHPQIVVVTDPTLLSSAEVFEGLEKGATAVINTSQEPGALKASFPLTACLKVVTVDASRIALEAFQRNVPNTPMLGALLRAAPVVSVESCLRRLRERLGAKLSPQVVEANAGAFQRAYIEAREG